MKSMPPSMVSSACGHRLWTRSSYAPRPRRVPPAEVHGYRGHRVEQIAGPRFALLIMPDKRPPFSPRLILTVLMVGLLVWAAYVAVGTYLYYLNPWRAVVVLGSMAVFLGCWILLLWAQSRRKRR